MLAAGIAVALILSLVTLVMALVARSAAHARSPGDADERVAALEERVRGLVYRVWKLEGGAGADTPLESPPAPDATPVVEAAPAPPSPGPSSVELAQPLEAPAPDAPAWGAPSPALRRGLDLEQRREGDVLGAAQAGRRSSLKHRSKRPKCGSKRLTSWRSGP